MKKQSFSGYSIFSASQIDDSIDIDTILKDFHLNNNLGKCSYTHFINERWENTYINPSHIPSILPFLSFANKTANKLYPEIIKPHQTLMIPHELLGYDKNEFWFNAASHGETTSTHNHNEHALVSGVLYLQVPKNSGNIFLTSNR